MDLLGVVFSFLYQIIERPSIVQWNNIKSEILRSQYSAIPKIFNTYDWSTKRMHLKLWRVVD